MSGPMQAASLLPPLSRSTASTTAHDADMRTAAAEPADSAPFELTRLRLLPRPQRDAALEAEETPVQPRLEVGPADDAYEREADEIADTVMRMPADPAVTASSDTRIQRKCAACDAEDKVQRTTADQAETGPDIATGPQARLEAGSTGDAHEREAGVIADTAVPSSANANATTSAAGIRRKCAACEGEEAVERRTVAEAEAETGPPTLAASPVALRSGGAPLAAGPRSFYENRLGRDLSTVRVHQGTAAQALNDSIAARAFTFSNHVWLGRGEQVDNGFTMAHELAHVLQQTQPPALRRSRAPVATTTVMLVLQRKELRAFWLPMGQKKSALRLHTTIHNKAADALVKANTSTQSNDMLIREAPIPGGNRSGSTADPGLGLTKMKGFADIYMGHTTVGVQKNVAALKNPASNQPPINNFLGSRKSKPRFGYGLGEFKHSEYRAPKVDRSKNVTDLHRAPTRIRIADVKPGHNISARDDGVGQIGNYIAGIKDVAAATNSYIGPSDHWAADPDYMGASDLKPVTGWDPGLAGTHPSSPKLKLHAGGEDIAVSRTKGRPKYDTEIRGSWAIARDRKNDGIWCYFLLPDQNGLDQLLAAPKTSEQFKQIALQLKEKVLDDLVKPPAAPASPAATGVKPRRLSRRASRPPTRVAQRRMRVQRAPRGKAAAPAPKDTFDFKAWNARRTGKGGKTTSFREDVEATFGDTGATVKFQKEVVESLDLIKEHFDFDRSISNRTRIEADAKALEKFEFWVSPAGYVIGRLRQVFGRAFIKVWTLGERMKTWLAKKLEKFKFSGQGKTGGLKGVAMKIGATLVKAIGPLLLRKTTEALAECVRLGLTRTMEDLVNGPLETLKEKQAEIERFVADAETKLLAKIDSLFGDIITPLQEKFDQIRDEAEFIIKLVGIIKEAIDLARIAICIAGGVETFGISCAVAAIDKVLSIFDVSPIDKIAGAIMQSCEAQKFIAEYLAAKTFLADIPKMIAAKVMEPIRNALPEGFKGLVCRDEDFKIAPFDFKELNCQSGGGSGGTSDGGEGGTGTPRPEGKAEERPEEGEPGTAAPGKAGQGKAGQGKAGPGKAGGETGSGAPEKPSQGTPAGSPAPGVPVYAVKPVPPGAKPSILMTIPILLVDGMPTKAALEPGKAIPVTLVLLKSVDTGFEPFAVVRGVPTKFFEVGDPKDGFVRYKIAFENDFYIDEIEQIVYAKPDNASNYTVSGLGPEDASGSSAGSAPASGTGTTPSGSPTAGGVKGAIPSLAQQPGPGGSGEEEQGVGFEVKDPRDCDPLVTARVSGPPKGGSKVVRLDRGQVFAEFTGSAPRVGSIAGLTLYFRSGTTCASLPGVSVQVLDVQQVEGGTSLDLLVQSPVHVRVPGLSQTFLLRGGVWWFTPDDGLMIFYRTFDDAMQKLYRSRAP